MVVPVDLGVQDSLRGFMGNNFSEESGLKAGEVEEKEGVWIEKGPLRGRLQRTSGKWGGGWF